MKIEFQKSNTGFNLITIAFVRNEHGTLYNRYVCFWLFNVGIVFKWRKSFK